MELGSYWSRLFSSLSTLGEEHDDLMIMVLQSLFEAYNELGFVVFIPASNEIYFRGALFSRYALL